MNRNITFVALLTLSACATKTNIKSHVAPIQPYQPALARVALMNSDLQFVVLDFSGRSVPPAGTRFEIYRGEQVIGAVETTEPMQGRLTTADILQGAVRVGDEVR